VPMRITLDIPDETYARLEALAKQEGTTVQAIILRGIDAVLQEEGRHFAPKRSGRFKIPLIRSTRPGTLKLGEEGVYEYIDFP